MFDDLKDLLFAFNAVEVRYLAASRAQNLADVEGSDAEG